MVSLKAGLPIFVGFALVAALVAVLIKKFVLDKNEGGGGGGSPGGTPPCNSPGCSPPPPPSPGNTFPCGTGKAGGLCDKSQECVQIKNADCSSAFLTEKRYSCSQEGSHTQTKFKDCVLGCNDQGQKEAFYCRLKKTCYDTTDPVSIPESQNNFYPVYNVDAWQDYATKKCEAPGDYPDSYCTKTARHANMGEIIYSYMPMSPELQDHKTLKDTQKKVTDYFSQDSYLMRQSPLGYACLPTKKKDGSSGPRPQGYRYVLYPLDHDSDPAECAVTDCADAALGSGIKDLMYDDGNKSCIAVVCEGDECSSMTHSTTPEKLKDPETPYCSFAGEAYDTFRKNNCQGVDVLDCFPDIQYDDGFQDQNKLAQDTGLQFWQPGQLDLHWFVKNDSKQFSAIIEFMTLRDPADPNKGRDQVGDPIYTPSRSYYCNSPSQNMLDYLGKKTYVDMNGTAERCTDFSSLLQLDIPTALASEPRDFRSDITCGYSGSSDYSTKLYFDITDWYAEPWQCRVKGDAHMDPSSPAV